MQATIKTELYPRSQIDIFVEVLQADGGNYCACVNAATLALIDAGIPLKDYVTACTASLGEEPWRTASLLAAVKYQFIFLLYPSNNFD